MMLERHVLYFERKELAPLLAAVKNISGFLGVDVYLDDAALAEKDYRVACAQDIIFNLFFVEAVKIDFAALEAEQELRAIAEFKFGILVEC